jgi:hypothetical protein
VIHKPCRLLGDTQVTGHFTTGYAVLAVADQPGSEHPFVHPEGRIFKDAANLNGELLFAALAEPNLPSRYKRVLFGGATWAGNAIRPSQSYGSGKRLVRIGKVADCGLKSFGKIGW